MIIIALSCLDSPAPLGFNQNLTIIILIIILRMIKIIH